MAFHRDFKGVWIPKEIWLSADLSLQEKCLLVEINSLEKQNGCHATNKHFVDFLGMSDRTVRRAISEMKKRGLLSVKQKNTAGKMTRIVKSIWPKWPHGTWPKVVKPSGQLGHISTNIYIHKSNTLQPMIPRKKVKKVEGTIAASEYNDVYRIVDGFEPVNKHWASLHANPKQYDAAIRLLKIHGISRILKVMATLSKSNEMEFFPRIFTPQQLEQKWESLEHAWRDAVRKKVKKAPKVLFS